MEGYRRNTSAGFLSRLAFLLLLFLLLRHLLRVLDMVQCTKRVFWYRRLRTGGRKTVAWSKHSERWRRL